MQIQILAAAKPSLSFAKEGVELYMKRIQPFGKVELKYVRDGSSADVSARLLQASEGSLRIALDERGSTWTTAQFTDKAKAWQLHSVKRISFLIGAADGHTEALRASSEHLLSLSGFTLQHELALVVLLEQIYRVHTILVGTPYHRP